MFPDGIEVPIVVSVEPAACVAGSCRLRPSMIWSIQRPSPPPPLPLPSPTTKLSPPSEFEAGFQPNLEPLEGPELEGLRPPQKSDEIHPYHHPSEGEALGSGAFFYSHTECHSDLAVAHCGKYFIRLYRTLWLGHVMA